MEDSEIVKIRHDIRKYKSYIRKLILLISTVIGGSLFLGLGVGLLLNHILSSIYITGFIGTIAMTRNFITLKKLRNKLKISELDLDKFKEQKINAESKTNEFEEKDDYEISDEMMDRMIEYLKDKITGYQSDSTRKNTINNNAGDKSDTAEIKDTDATIQELKMDTEMEFQAVLDNIKMEYNLGSALHDDDTIQQDRRMKR